MVVIFARNIKVMPRANCSVLGCRLVFGSCLWQKTKLMKNGESSGEIKRQEMDQNFREQLKSDRIYTCEKHFAAEDIEICKYMYTYLYFHVKLSDLL